MRKEIISYILHIANIKKLYLNVKTYAIIEKKE